MAVAEKMNYEKGVAASLQVAEGLDHVPEDIETHLLDVGAPDVAASLLNAFSGLAEVVDKNDAH